MSRLVTTLAGTFVLALSSAFVLGGCAGDSIGSDSSNVTDSWYTPTSHGELSFEYANKAEFDAEHRFHRWTFTLTGDAEVDLTTVLSTANLDSIAYLYKRNAETGKWGNFIAKNDDHDGGPASRIKKKLDAGEYQLKVRAYKSFQTGNFSVDAKCDGAGCPAVAVDSCTPDERYDMPADTDPTDACVAALDTILLTPISASFYSSVSPSTRCEDGSIAAKGFDFYGQYWDNIGYGWNSVIDDYFDGDESAVELNVQVTIHGDAGAMASVDMGGDEDNVTFIFDNNGDMIGYYHSEQSPTSGFSCGKYPGAEHPYVDEDCFGNALHYLSHETSEVQEADGSSSSNDAGSLHVTISKAIAYFAEKQGLAADVAIDYSYALWDGDYGAGATVDLSHGDTSVTYRVANEYNDHVMIVTEIAGDKTTMVCEDR